MERMNCANYTRVFMTNYFLDDKFNHQVWQLELRILNKTFKRKCKLCNYAHNISIGFQLKYEYEVRS